LISTSFEKSKNSILFKIFYDFNKHIFYLMNLDVGYGIFCKIEEYVIKENSIINIGESYLFFFSKKIIMKMKKK